MKAIRKLIDSEFWYFLKTEIPQLMSNWRIVPRGLMLAYGLAFYNTINWFMVLENPNNAQAGFVSVVVGAGAAWFAIYVNGKPTIITDSKEEQTLIVKKTDKYEEPLR